MDRLEASRKFAHHLADDGVCFKAEVFNKLCGPIVYLFLNEGVATYVGMSRRGIERPAFSQHAKKAQRAACDEVMVFPCKSASDAAKLERLLIGSLRPPENNKGQHQHVARLLGLAGKPH